MRYITLLCYAGTMTEAEEFGKQILEYCDSYKIPKEYLYDILIDQKVVPMIRGKATEYATLLLLQRILDPREWAVAKLNLNAQTGTHDEDVTVTHQRTGIIIKVECKNASRGSFKFSSRAKKYPNQVFCTIKCHKSRSDLSKAETTNDRYLVGDFDIVISNLSNAVIAGATYTKDFELISNHETVRRLADYYHCQPTYIELFEATYNDWRFAFQSDILDEQGIAVQRTPAVVLKDYSVWHKIEDLDHYLSMFVRDHLERRRIRR